MDKAIAEFLLAEIRAKARKLVNETHDVRHQGINKQEDVTEAALTAACDAGWNERGEADEQAIGNNVRAGWTRLKDHVNAIRRLRKEEEK